MIEFKNEWKYPKFSFFISLCHIAVHVRPDRHLSPMNKSGCKFFLVQWDLSAPGTEDGLTPLSVCSVDWWSVSTTCCSSGWPGTRSTPWRTTWTSALIATPPCEPLSRTQAFSKFTQQSDTHRNARKNDDSLSTADCCVFARRQQFQNVWPLQRLTAGDYFNQNFMKCFGKLWVFVYQKKVPTLQICTICCPLTTKTIKVELSSKFTSPPLCF